MMKNMLVVALVMSIASISHAEDRLPTIVSFDLLNKLSSKKHRIKIPLGAAYVIQDIRIVPRSCTEFKDELYNKKDTHLAQVEVFLEQDFSVSEDGQEEQEEPILLYKGGVSNNTRTPSPPLEHPIYDLIFVGCG